jgi:hypothetical protein
MNMLVSWTVLLAVGASACAAQTIKTPRRSASVAAQASPPAAGTGQCLGQSVVLAGQDSGEKIKLTVVALKDPARPANHYITAGKGKRYVGVEVRLTNVGTVVYKDSPSNGATLVGTSGHEYNAEFGDIGGEFAGNTIDQVGDDRVGVLPFTVPKTDKPHELQFTLDSGFGPDTGQCTF